MTRISGALDFLPEDEGAPIEEMEAQYGSIYSKASYGLQRVEDNSLEPRHVIVLSCAVRSVGSL